MGSGLACGVFYRLSSAVNTWIKTKTFFTSDVDDIKQFRRLTERTASLQLVCGEMGFLRITEIALFFYIKVGYDDPRRVYLLYREKDHLYAERDFVITDMVFVKRQILQPCHLCWVLL